MAALLPSVGVVVAERATGLGKEDVVEAGSEMCIRDSLEVGRVECAHQRWHRRLAAVDVEADQAVLGAGLTDEGQRLQLREGVLVLTLQGQGDGVAGDLTLECVGRTLDDDAAVVDDGHAVAERVRLLEVVGRQEHRGPAVAQLADLRPEVRPGLGIEAGGGLVEKDKAGPVHQADGDVETAPLAARVRLRLAGRAALDLEGLEQLSGTDLGLALAHPVEAPLEHKLAAPRLDDVAAARLADVADAASHQASLGEQVGARDHGLTARRREQGREHAQRRRLARAVGAEEAEDLAVAHLEVDATHGLDGASAAGGERAPKPARANGDAAVGCESGVFRGGDGRGHECSPREVLAISVSGRCVSQWRRPALMSSITTRHQASSASCRRRPSSASRRKTRGRPTSSISIRSAAWPPAMMPSRRTTRAPRAWETRLMGNTPTSDMAAVNTGWPATGDSISSQTQAAISSRPSSVMP